MMKQDQSGFTLLEVMISIFIFGLISALVFSILDRSFVFSAKGEARVLEIEQQYGLINLVRRQVQGAWFDQKRKKVHISSETENRFALITTSSLMYSPSVLVMAFYEFDPRDSMLYYTERRDFYNLDYRDEPPATEDMIPLLHIEGDFSLQADPDSDFVILLFKNKKYVFHPFCTEQSQEFDFEISG
jgi:prepilin-type N-terminal cleavage/methylation domain-containing protein